MTDLNKELQSKIKDCKNTNSIFNTEKYVLLKDVEDLLDKALNMHVVGIELPTSTELISDCTKRFKDLEGKGNLDYRSYRSGYLDSFSKYVLSKIKR